MRKLLVVLVVLFCECVFAQSNFERPNYETIKENIEDKNSNYFYQSLMVRFAKADTTMTLKEKRHLYYGYIFHENYSPYNRSSYEDSLHVALDQPSIDQVDFKKIEKFTNLLLEEKPLDLNALEYQLYALDYLGKYDVFVKRQEQLRMLLQAILSSGDGLSKESAFYVINTTDEYKLVQAFGYEFGGSQSLIEHYDYLTLEVNEDGIEGLYFDVSPCLGWLGRKYKK